MGTRSYVDRWIEIRDQRIAKFAEYGIKAKPGQCLGDINLSAGESRKLLMLLQKKARTA